MLDYVYKQRCTYPSVAAGLTLGANSCAHTCPVNVSHPPRLHLLWVVADSL
jgi:hypothetical protein